MILLDCVNSWNRVANFGVFRFCPDVGCRSRVLGLERSTQDFVGLLLGLLFSCRRGCRGL